MELIGKIDVIEGGADGIELIDYEKGGARRDEQNQRVSKDYDAIQIAAYALLLEGAGKNPLRGLPESGVDARAPLVRTIWQFDEGELVPRLITAHFAE